MVLDVESLALVTDDLRVERLGLVDVDALEASLATSRGGAVDFVGAWKWERRSPSPLDSHALRSRFGHPRNI
jgi:hypothetical protein